MDMDKSAVFFVGSILVMMGLIVIAAGIVAINNILHRWWKPVKMIHYETRFATEEELIKIEESSPKK